MASLRLIVLAAALLAGVAFAEADDIRSAPWMAQIDGHGGYTCAGSIMDSTHILTAAHCFHTADVAATKAFEVKVRVGAANWKNGGEEYDVVKIDTHPMANGGANEMFDLAVMTLAKPIQFSETVQPIEFVKVEVEGPLEVFGAGWGSANPGHDALQTFSMNMLPTEWCQHKLAFTSIESANRAALMCMAPKTGMSCAGDSGSGVWTTKFGKPQLMGVLQSAASCTAAGSASLYVNALNENHRQFLSQFLNMNGVPVVHDFGPVEDLATKINYLRTQPGGIPESMMEMVKAIGVTLN